MRGTRSALMAPPGSDGLNQALSSGAPGTQIRMAPTMSGSPTAPPAPRVGERIYLVDANNVAHRLFHSNAPCHAPADPSLPIHVVLAWTRRMRSLRRGHDPAYLLPIFDGPGDNWRRALLPAYKLARKPQAPELASQWGMIARVSEALGLTPLRQPGLEADDLIAGYTKAAFAAGLEITIVSNDSDLMQLIQGRSKGRARFGSSILSAKVHGPS